MPLIFSVTPVVDALLRCIVLPLGDRLFHQRMMTRLAFLERAQYWPQERLSAFRSERLQELMKTAYEEVPFYRSLMQASGVTWRDFRRPSDLREIPVVTKRLLRSNYPQKTTRITGLKTYEVCTSGSTGSNFYVKEDSDTAGWYRASLLLALEWAGWRLGEPHVQMGMNLTRGLQRKLKDLFLRCHYVSAFDLTDDHLDEVLSIMEKRSIQHLWGYPGSVYWLARRAETKGWNRPLKSVVCWGDNLYAHYRSIIKRVFRTRVIDTYGAAEGIQIAAQCPENSHYHIHSTDVIIELLDADGNPVSPGEPGHVVVTRLHPGPMPLIRYTLGDLAVAPQREACSCGRTFELLESIQGRDTDIVLTPSGNRLIVHFFTGILEHIRDIECFQVQQRQPQEIDLYVVRAAGAMQSEQELSENIIGDLRGHGLRDMNIHVEFVNQISASPSGKRRFVVSELPRPFA